LRDKFLKGTSLPFWKVATNLVERNLVSHLGSQLSNGTSLPGFESIRKVGPDVVI
jgi:hypothetical protein